MKKILILLFLFMAFWGRAQSGISYQAVIMSSVAGQLPGADNPKSPLVDASICLRLAITSPAGIDYEEQITTTTDSFGMVNVVFGDGSRSSTGGTAANLAAISWGSGPKTLKVELDETGSCATFTLVSNQPFTGVPFAYYAASLGSGGGSTTTTLTGDVSGSATTGSITTTITNAAVNFTKIQDVNTDKVLGNFSGTTGSVQELATTGSGDVVRATSPTLVTPVLGVATASSMNKVVITAPTSGATLTITDGKTLTATDNATVSNTNTGDQTITLTGDVMGSGTGSFTTTVGKINGTSLAGLATGILKNTTSTGIPSIAVATDFPILNQNTTGTSDNVTGTVAIANGGTGQTTKATAFDALSPMTAAGDIIYGGTNGAGSVLVKGTDGQVLTLASGAPSWANPDGVKTMGPIGNVPNANGATISGVSLNLQPASYNYGGVVSTEYQIFAGSKMFKSVINVVPDLPAGGDGASSVIGAQNGFTSGSTSGGALTLKAGNANGGGTGGNIYINPGTSGSGTKGIAQINGQVNIIGNTAIAGDTSLGGYLAIAGATTIGLTLGVAGDLSVNTDKFKVIATNGNTTVAGTLNAGASTLASATVSGTLNAGSIQNTPIGSTTASTGNFTTLASSSNATIGGTLDVTSATTLNDNLTVRGLTGGILTNKFTVDATTGNTTIVGTTPLEGTLSVNKIIDSTPVSDRIKTVVTIPPDQNALQINAMSGRFRIFGTNTVSVSNTYVKSNSIILCNISNNSDTDCYLISVDAFNNSFTVLLSRNANPEIHMNFFVINPNP